MVSMNPLVIAGRAFQSRLIVGTGKYKDGAETQAAIDVLVARGEYRPTPTEIIDFDAVPDALTRLANRETTGRVVVRC